MKPYIYALIATLAVLATACGPSSLRVAPVKIEPIHMQIDVTLHDGDADPAQSQPVQK